MASHLFNDLSRISQSVRRKKLDPCILNLAPGFPHDIVATGGAWNFSTLPRSISYRDIDKAQTLSSPSS